MRRKKIYKKLIIAVVLFGLVLVTMKSLHLKKESGKSVEEGMERSGYYYIDPNGNILNSIPYKQVDKYSFSKEGIAFVSEVDCEGTDRAAFIDRNGNIIGDKRFSKEGAIFIDTFSFPIIVREAENVVIYDENLNKIGQLKGDYDANEVFYNNSSFGGELGAVSVLIDGNRLWGYINTSGDWVIEPKYAWAGTFTEDGVACVEDPDTGLRGYIDTEGNLIIDYQFYDGRPFCDGYALVQKEKDGKIAYINTKGEFITDFVYDSLSSEGFADGLASVEINEDKQVYINGQGEVAIDPDSPIANKFSQGLAFVGGGKFIDKNANVVINVVIDGYVESAEPFGEDGYSVVTTKVKEYTEDGEYSDDKGKYQYTEKYGVIDTKGEWLYEPQFMTNAEYTPPQHKDGYFLVYLEKGQSIKKATK